MYPRFLQLFLNNQIENLEAVFNDEYDTPSHTKKVFANMKRQGKDFSGSVTPLFETILTQHLAKVGEDETIHEEKGDRMERDATTASSLESEQDSGTINRTQSTAILNEHIPQGTGLGGRPRCSSFGNSKLKKRVKRLEKKRKPRPLQLKRRLFKVRIESSTEKSLETQGSALVTTTGVSVSTVKPSTPPTTTTTTLIEDEDLTIAQTLIKMRSVKSKEKSKEKRVSSTRLARGVFMKEASETASGPMVPPQQQLDLKDKVNGIMQELEKLVKVKGKDQIALDEEVA
nr:hypothetical protein [Tanacetum cinerariifolium]